MGKKKYRRSIVGDFGQQIQMNIKIMSEKKNDENEDEEGKKRKIDIMKQENDGYGYILMATEELSQYAFAERIKRKTGDDIAEAMELILSEFKVRFGKYPDAVQFDNGNEFKNKFVNKLLDDLDIKHFSTLVKRGGKAFFRERQHW